MNQLDLTCSFNRLTVELDSVSPTRDKQKINLILDELNSLDYKRCLFVSNPDSSKVIYSLCSHICPQDAFIVAKSCHLILNLLTQQDINSDTRNMESICLWLIKCISENSDIVLTDILQTLNVVLQKINCFSNMLIEELIGENNLLVKVIQRNSVGSLPTIAPTLQFENILLSLKCMMTLIKTEPAKSLNHPSFVSETHLIICANAVIDLFFGGRQKGQDNFNYMKIVINALRILSHIYINNPSLPKKLPETIGLGRSFMVFGINNCPLTLQKISPAQQAVAEPLLFQNAKGGKKQKQRKQRNTAIEKLKKNVQPNEKQISAEVEFNKQATGYHAVNNSFFEAEYNFAASPWPVTSDSEVSDLENSKDAKMQKLKAQIRQSAFGLLLALIKITDKREMFGYWWALIPDCHEAGNWSKELRSHSTVLYCALHDPTLAGRAGALSVILALLTGSKPYLAQAEWRNKSVSTFTPFSVTLSHMIGCLHSAMVTMLSRERAPSAIVATLKCCSSLVQATPYHKMQDGLISNVVQATRRYLVHSDYTVQVSALIVIGCILSIDPSIDEVLISINKEEVSLEDLKESEKRLSESEQDIIYIEETCSDSEEMPVLGSLDEQETSNVSGHYGDNNRYFKSWILDICFKNLGWILRNNEIVKLEPVALPICLESLQVFSAMAFHHFKFLLSDHVRLLADVFADGLKEGHAEMILHTAKCVGSVADALQKLEQSGSSSPTKLDDSIYYWEKLLSGPLTNLLQSNLSSASTKAVVCDCIANIGENTFKELQRRTQFLCVTLLFGCCTDEDALVRAAAVRALAMCVMYRTLREDVGFVSDCGESVLRALRESSEAVRTKASWSLGNLSDSLVLNLSDPELETIDDNLLLRLLEASIQCSSDNDKLKMNATRAIGNLLRLMNKERLKPESKFKTLTECAVERLVECASKSSNMKIRWNACYAIGNVMKCVDIFLLNDWQKSVFGCLCKLVVDCRNLKVRINATVALRTPAIRSQYDKHLPSVWTAVMAAMENATNVDDFTEFRHKDNLIEQLCMTLSHLCQLLVNKDLPDILDPLSFHYDCAKSLYKQLHQRLPPQSNACLSAIEAAKYVTISLAPETEAQKQSLCMLQDIFILDYP